MSVTVSLTEAELVMTSYSEIRPTPEQLAEQLLPPQGIYAAGYKVTGDATAGIVQYDMVIAAVFARRYLWLPRMVSPYIEGTPQNFSIEIGVGLAAKQSGAGSVSQLIGGTMQLNTATSAVALRPPELRSMPGTPTPGVTNIRLAALTYAANVNLDVYYFLTWGYWWRLVDVRRCLGILIPP